MDGCSGMNKQEIEQRLEVLTALAAERMDKATHLPGMVYAGIFWLTVEEVAEHHALVQALQALTKDSAENARLRIQEKIKQRKDKRCLHSLKVAVY